MPSLEPIPIVTCPVSISYRKVGRVWHARALQFDLIGTGTTRAKAFDEVKSLIEAYIMEVMTTLEPTRLFNFSDPEEWGNSDQSHYQVTMLFDRQAVRAHLPKSLPDIESARKFKDSLQGISLQPAFA